MATEVTSRLEQVVARASKALDSLGCEWALVGGLAVSARAEPRFTRDVDLAVALPGDREAEALVLALQRLGFNVLVVLEHDPNGRLATVRLQPPGSGEHGAIVDLLIAASGIESEIVDRATVVEVFPGLRLPVATVGDLLAMKILSRDDERRPQDAADIRALLREAGDSDFEVTKGALLLVIERGYHRSRDLVAEFEALKRNSGSARSELRRGTRKE